jgi:hypothetical protein
VAKDNVGLEVSGMTNLNGGLAVSGGVTVEDTGLTVNGGDVLLDDSKLAINVDDASLTHMLSVQGMSEIAAPVKQDVICATGTSSCDDLTISAGAAYTGHTQSTFIIIITAQAFPCTAPDICHDGQAADAFIWKKDIDGVASAQMDITAGVPQLLDEGVSVQFASNVGHKSGNMWNIGVTVSNALSVQDLNGQQTFEIGQDGSVTSHGGRRSMAD